MTPDDKIQAVLLATAGVTSLTTRIMAGEGGQLVARPYIRHFPVGVDPIHTQDALMGLRSWPFYQVSCFADSHSGARALADAVTASLGSYKGSGWVIFLAGEQAQIFEPDTGVHQIPVLFNVHGSQSD